jgi:DNA-binding MarR family transcriptional regulator
MSPRHGLGTRLRKLVEALDGDVQQLYDELGSAFRPRFFPIVQKLRRDGPAGVSEIAGAAGVSQPAATQTLREMETAGLIAFEIGADRRKRLAAISAEGERRAAALDPVWKAVEQAHAALEAELGNRLSTVVDQALAALDREPFAARIRKTMRK